MKHFLSLLFITLLLFGCASGRFSSSFQETYKSNQDITWNEYTADRNYESIFQDVRFGVQRCWASDSTFEEASMVNQQEGVAQIHYPSREYHHGFDVWIKRLSNEKSLVRVGVSEGAKIWDSRPEIRSWVNGNTACL